MKLHPGVAGRDCGDCRKWQYADTDEVGGKLLRRGGLPIMRPPGQPPPCRRCPKIPDGVDPAYWNAVEWSDKNWKAFRFHQQCAAVGRFPDDAIVRRNAGLIESTLADLRDHGQRSVRKLLASFLTLTFKA